ELWSEELLRERARRVVRFDLQVRTWGSSAPTHHQWIGKFYDLEETGRRAAAIVRALASTDCGPRGNAVFPEFLAWHPPLRLLFLTYQEGEGVISALGGPASNQVLAATGRVLATLHTTTVHPWALSTTTILLHDLEQRIRDLSEWFRPMASFFGDILHRLRAQ